MIAVIGMGSMGTAIAEGLLAAGREVTVFNRTPAKTEPLASRGALVADTAAAAMISSDLTIVVLPDAASTRELLFDPSTAPALNGRLIMNVAHTSPTDIIELAEDVAGAGGTLCEVNVTVYPDPVRDRAGHFIIACAPEHADTWTAVFRDLGSHVHYVGAVGNASCAEFALWLSYMFQPVAAAYSAAAFATLGLPQDALLSTLSESPTLRIASAELMIPQMAARAYRHDSFSVDNFAYSVDLVLNDAEALGLPTKLFKDIRDLFKEASSLGHGSSDASAVYEVLVRDSAASALGSAQAPAGAT